MFHYYNFICGNSKSSNHSVLTEIKEYNEIAYDQGKCKFIFPIQDLVKTVHNQPMT